MLASKEFVELSLELNLFFLRVMKEHMIFTEISLPIKESHLILEADNMKISFEGLLKEATDLARGNISKEAIESKEFVTPYTLDAEMKLEALFGACINKDITKAQMDLVHSKDVDTYNMYHELEKEVFDLNNRIINLLMDLIKYKEDLLSNVLNCKLATYMYPEMLDHLVREAKFYMELLLDLQERKKDRKKIIEKQIFWNHIMEDHAQFIRGYLDPSEKELMKKANEYAKLFERLLKETKEADKKNIGRITERNLKAAEDIMEFKKDGTEGLLKCEIRGILNPLLADHTLREANRYIRLLKEYLRKDKK